MVSGRFLRFAVAGAVGFGFDAAVLLLLTREFAASPFLARAVSFVVALTVTWAINRRWAFAEGARIGAGPVAREYLNYGAVQMAGGAVNLAVFAATLSMLGDAAWLQIGAVAIGAVAGMLVNYFGNRTLVFGAGGGRRRLLIAGLWAALAVAALLAAALKT